MTRVLNLASSAALGFWAAYIAMGLLVDQEVPPPRSAGFLLLFWIVNWITDMMIEPERQLV